MGTTSLQPEKEFTYTDGRTYRLQWILEPFSGTNQLCMLRQDGDHGEWWIAQRLTPPIRAEVAAAHPGGPGAYYRDVIVPMANAEIAKLLAVARENGSRDPATGIWPNPQVQLEELLRRSTAVDVQPSGDWALRAIY